MGSKSTVSGIFRRRFIWLGNKYNRLETIINRKFLKIETPDELFVKPLSDDVALEKGIEFFYELLVYMILIGLPLYELYTTSASNDKKAKELSNRLNRIESNISSLKEESIKANERLRTSIEEIENMIKGRQPTSMDTGMQQNRFKAELIKYLDSLDASYYSKEAFSQDASKSDEKN